MTSPRRGQSKNTSKSLISTNDDWLQILISSPPPHSNPICGGGGALAIPPDPTSEPAIHPPFRPAIYDWLLKRSFCFDACPVMPSTSGIYKFHLMNHSAFYTGGGGCTKYWPLPNSATLELRLRD